MSNYDLGAVFAALFTAWLGPQLGPVIGIYSVIVIAAVVGAGLALLREKEPRQRPILFASLLAVATIIVSVPLTIIVAPRIPALGAQVLLPVVTLLVALIGQDWVRFFEWVWGLRERVLPSRLRREPDQGSNQ